MAYEWHSTKAASNLEKHGVLFAEAATVFDDPLQVHYPDHAHSIGEQRFICLGMSNQGRLLKLAYTEKTPNLFRIITAREATPAEETSRREDMNETIRLLEDDDYDLDDDLPAELPLEVMTPDVERTRRFRARALQGMIRLAPDVAEVFDSSEAVNEALRTLIRLNRAEKKAA